MCVAVVMNLHKIRVDTSQEQRVIKQTHWRSVRVTPGVQVQFEQKWDIKFELPYKRDTNCTAVHRH